MEYINQILDSPMLSTIAGGAIVFLIALFFLRKLLFRLVIFAVAVAAAVYFYNNYWS